MKPSEHLKESAKQLRKNIDDQQITLKGIEQQIREAEEHIKQLQSLHTQTRGKIEQLINQARSIEQQAADEERKERTSSGGLF